MECRSTCCFLMILLLSDLKSPFLCIYVTRLIIYSATITPYRIAFEEVTKIGWTITDSIVDLLFAVDLVLTFFTAYLDAEENIVTKKRVIAIHYIKTWFFLDLISIAPISLIFQRDYASLAKLARIPRLYKLIKMVKIVNISKAINNKQSISKVGKVIRQKSNIERLVLFLLLFLLCSHVLACIWSFIGSLENKKSDSWLGKISMTGSSNFEKYITSLYYIITTICTVGYGDITPITVTEKIFAMCLMITGILAYSFAVGSLT